jgi:phosphoenolpyruvate synthase/pyruvate phosphate dikinase
MRTLGDMRRHDADECGAKAAWLGELAARGYLVPASLVIPTSVYRGFLQANGLTDLVRRWTDEALSAPPAWLLEIERAAATRFAAATLADDARAAIAQWANGSATTTFAVRSSATHEDLPHACFAGQYDSFLRVAPPDIPAAVVRCFAGLFNARAAFYRRRAGIAETGEMAVLIQQMVPADHAGVVFTAAPHDASLLLLECIPGLGDGVVSGAATPNRYYFRRSTLALERSVEVHACAQDAVTAAARVALTIEAALGRPQNVEYGAVGADVFILQARPIASPPTTRAQPLDTPPRPERDRASSGKPSA